jgi:hypothetical protein
MKKLSFKKLLDSTKRTQYTNEEVVDSVKPCEPQKIEFFTIGEYISDDNLEREYEKRGLIPANPYALTLFSKENETVMDDKKYVATHWKDVAGKWCYAAFGRRGGGERGVSVYRYDDGWFGSWWFAGVRKFLGTLDTESLSESLDTLKLEISEIVINGKKYKLVEG